MTPDGPFPFGAGGDDPGGPEHHEASDPVGGDVGGADLNGWVPPEDRTWRHPSELSSQVSSWTSSASMAWSSGVGSPGWSRRRRVATSLVATGAVVAVAVGVVLMNAVGVGVDGHALGTASTSTTTAFTTNAAPDGAMPPAAAAVTAGLVSLTFATPAGRQSICGVAVAEDGLVATAADALEGATRVTVVLPGGHRGKAQPVATDIDSDVALFRVPFDLPVPPFDSAPVPGGGGKGVVVSATGGGKSSGPRWSWAPGVIEGAGAPVGSSDTGLMGITAASPAEAPPGGVLVEQNGDVAGLLDHSVTSPSGSSVQVFVPSWLLLGVSSELAAWGTVHHGWLDVMASDVPGGHGALVQRVEPDGASGGVLQAGDVIVGVGAFKVRSMAELRERLYLLGPGTPVRLEVERGGETATVVVNLAPSAYRTATSHP